MKRIPSRRSPRLAVLDHSRVRDLGPLPVSIECTSYWRYRKARAMPSASLAVRGVIRSTSRAKDREIVHLVFLGTHQNHAAPRASEINRMIACVENWRCADKAHVPRSNNRFKADLKSCGHGLLLEAAINADHPFAE
jgi:hypothetical protein